MRWRVALLLARRLIVSNEVSAKRNGVLLLGVKNSQRRISSVGKEFDTYKINTTANSTSTMHKLASTPITLDCFETDDLVDELHVVNEAPLADVSLQNFINGNINYLEKLRQKYNETKDKKYWKELIRWLPESWLQTRTITMNYENILSICQQRKGHKLTEWKSFINWAKELPYSSELLLLGDSND